MLVNFRVRGGKTLTTLVHNIIAEPRKDIRYLQSYLALLPSLLKYAMKADML